MKVRKTKNFTLVASSTIHYGQYIFQSIFSKWFSLINVLTTVHKDFMAKFSSPSDTCIFFPDMLQFLKIEFQNYL